ncbi:MAG: c-type cytochrome [Pseudomonadota bacterium]
MKTVFLFFLACLSLVCLPISAAFASGDATVGKALYQSRCIACHSIDVNLAGPAHRGVVGSKAGRVAGFDYSPALKKSKLIWNEKNLNNWLTNPEKLIPGQKLGYAVTDANERQDLIAYLKSQSQQ